MTSSEPRSKRRWTPEDNLEAQEALRLLNHQTWLLPERHDSIIKKIRRNQPLIQETLSRLGWVLVVEKDLIRLRKTPPRRRVHDGPTPLQASWFFLLVAAAESLSPKVALSQLVSAARSAAAEAEIAVSNDITERRAIVRALHMLDERGLITQMDGDVEGFIEDENAPVLMAIWHSRLAHVIANFTPGDPSENPEAWLLQIEREPDPARRMRQRLVDDTVVHACDLDEAEFEWLSKRVRGDDGEPLAHAFGLHLERRTEGAAFVVPEGSYRFPYELGPEPFPRAGTVPHASLLLCEIAAGSDYQSETCPGPGWRGLLETDVMEHLQQLAEKVGKGQGGWRRELVDNPKGFAEEIRRLLTGLDILRITEDWTGPAWWFSPMSGRWDATHAKATKAEDQNLAFDFSQGADA